MQKREMLADIEYILRLRKKQKDIIEESKRYPWFMQWLFMRRLRVVTKQILEILGE